MDRPKGSLWLGGLVTGSVVETSRLTMFVRSAGRDDAPPVVLLHALGETGESWAGVVPLLAGTLRVLAVDLRGHGRSEWSGPYSIDGLSDDVVALLDALDLPSAHVVGHSLGGVVAYVLAERHPGRLARLVLEDPPAPVPRPPRLPDRPAGELDFDWALVEPLVAEANDPPPHRWEELSQVTAPTLVIGGGPTSHIDQTALAAMAGRIPSARFTTVAAGHLAHVERPGEVAGLVLAHLAAPSG